METLNQSKESPDWLLKSITFLLPKNKDTIQPKNYHPITLKNAMYKVYTSILAELITDHCERNNIITEEQAAGRRGSWGCADQLMINKMICEEVISARENLVTVWFDYLKAFDSVPHTWIIKSLELANVPQTVIEVIKQLIHKCKTQARLNDKTSDIETDFISYLRGILQGDMLSLILFVLAVNPLSFLLNKHEGYQVGKTIKWNMSNLFFADDLKLYAQNILKMIKILETVIMFSKDIGMNFLITKCAYQYIERGRRIVQNESLVADNREIHKIAEGDQYKYLGMDLIGRNPLN